MHNNEIMGFSGITRKRLASSIDCDILLAVKRYLEERRERHDRYDRKSFADSRRGSRTAPGQKIYSTQVHQSEAARGRQGRRALSGEARGPRGLHSQEHHEQIKIATAWWHATIKQFTAVRLLLLRFPRPSRSSPCMTLPISILTLIYKICQWLVMARVHEGRCTHE